MKFPNWLKLKSYSLGQHIIETLVKLLGDTNLIHVSHMNCITETTDHFHLLIHNVQRKQKSIKHTHTQNIHLNDILIYKVSA